MAAESYRPKNIAIDEIVMTNFDGSSSKDLSSIFTDLNIYEDMFQSQLMGDITIEDSNELIETFPIVGEETIRIRWHIPNTSNKDYFDTLDMRVYKVGDRSVSGKKGGKSSTYTLYFISPEAITNLNTTISRSFNTKTASDIVKTIYTEYIGSDKDLYVEDTEGKLKEVIPNWKPFRAINWLGGNRALTEKKRADFFFFEALNGNKGPRFNFVSMTTLMEQESVFTVEFVAQNISTGETKDRSSAAYNVDSFAFPKHGNILDNIANGQYAQTWIYHDPLRKRFVVSKPIHSDDFELSEGHKFYSKNLEETSANPMQFVRMPGGVNSFPPFSSGSNSLDNGVTKTGTPNRLRKQVPYIANRENKDELDCESFVSTQLYRRAFKIQELTNYVVSFGSIPGNEHIKLGSVIQFNKPHLVNNNKLYNDKLGRFDDRFLSGKYLVMRMRHNISISAEESELKYDIALEGIKTFFPEEISNKEVKG